MKRHGYIGAAVFAALWATGSSAELEVDIIPQAPPPQVQIEPGGVQPRKADVPYASIEEAGDRNVVPEETDVMVFMNQDRLHGRLLSVSGSDTLRWKHENAVAPIEFSLDAISEVKLAKRPSNYQPQNSVVELTNDDVFSGDIASMDTDSLVLNTWYAGAIHFKRVMVRSFSPSLATSSLAYEGPTSLDNWTFGSLGDRKAWRLHNGALVGKDPIPIGRNIESFPDSADIGFDIAWQGSPYFYFSFYTDNLRQYSGNCYALRISSSSAYLYRFEHNTSSHNLGSVNIQQFVNDGSNHLRINLLVDRNNKRFTLMINGTLVKQWTDTGGVATLGKGILFHPRNQAPIAISNIRISQWDGRAPQKIEVDKKAGEEDLVLFANGDKVSGRLISILDGQAKLETSYATLDIPLERISRVDLSTASQERARRNIGDVRAHFVGRGMATVKLAELNEKDLTGFSENFGNITMPVDAFRLVEFNIYEEKEALEDDLY